MKVIHTNFISIMAIKTIKGKNRKDIPVAEM
jgi:hypothetical protein